MQAILSFLREWRFSFVSLVILDVRDAKRSSPFLMACGKSVLLRQIFLRITRKDAKLKTKSDLLLSRLNSALFFQEQGVWKGDFYVSLL